MNADHKPLDEAQSDDAEKKPIHGEEGYVEDRERDIECWSCGFEGHPLRKKAVDVSTSSWREALANWGPFSLFRRLVLKVSKFRWKDEGEIVIRTKTCRCPQCGELVKYD
jgi:hypothetical protein